MKKLLSILLTLIFLLAPISITNAEGDNSDPITFFESTDNLANMKSYRMNQGIFGNFEVDSYGDCITGDFKMGILTDIYNTKIYESNTESKINGSINLKTIGDDMPFDNLIVNIRARIKTVFNDGIYIRLDNLNLKAIGVPKEDIEDYLDFKKEMKAEVDKIKGVWIYIPNVFYSDEINNNIPNAYSDFANTDKILNDIKDKGLKKFYKDAISELIESLHESGSITDKNYKNYTNINEKFHKTEFFSQKEINNGDNTGLISYRLNKRKVMQFIENISQVIGEKISISERIEMQSFFNKFSLFGLYSTDNSKRIFDSFKIRLVLKNIETLKGLVLGYTYKISKINEINKIAKPNKFTSIENLDLPFLPQSINNDFYFDDSEWDIDNDESVSKTPVIETDYIYSLNSDKYEDDDAVKGNEEAKVTIVEFSDYECPSCHIFSKSTLPKLIDKYINTGKVKFIYRDFPLDYHQNAKSAAIAAECAKKIGGDNMYYKYHDKLYENQSSFNIENFKKWANVLGLKQPNFNNCLDNEDTKIEVENDINNGQSLGINGTPTFFINGHELSGPQSFSAFEEIIEEELAK